MRRSHNTQAQSTASHCRLTSPHERMTVHGCTVMSALTGCQSYSKTTHTVLKVFKMSSCFPYSPPIVICGLPGSNTHHHHRRHPPPPLPSPPHYHHICYGVGPLVDPFQSHVSRSLFKGLPRFLLPVGQ